MPEASAVVAKIEEDAHVEEELARAKNEQGVGDAPSLDELQKILKGTGNTLGGLQSSAEDMIVYNRYDGEPSTITTDQAGQRLRVRFDDSHPWAGKLVWTTKAPESPPRPGVLLCPLHPESQERAYMDELRFTGILCRKSNMKTEMDVQDHFQGKHKKIYKAVEADKERQIKLQQMELMREQTNAMKAMAAAQGANGTGTETTAQAVEEVSEAESTAGETLPRCASCHTVIEGKLADHSC